jgi:hypothetical protein
VKVKGLDYNLRFIRITLEQGGEKHTLSLGDFSSYSGEALIVRLPKELKAGEVKFTIENSDGERYSTPSNDDIRAPGTSVVRRLS